jgi:hypothetical protein
MGGDSPLDWEGAISEVMGVEFNYDDAKYHYTKSGIERNVKKIVERIDREMWDRNIGFQVLGVMAMKTGAKLPKRVIKKIVEAAENDEWAKEGDCERKMHIEKFISAIKAHEPGKRTAVKSEGLFEKLVKG